MDYPLRATGARTTFVFLLALLVSACVSTGEGKISRKDHVQLEAALRSHIETLADDGFEGRKPGTRGETLTLDYLRNQFENIGFESGTNDPGNPWLAPVLLTASKPRDQKVALVIGRRTVALPTDQLVFYSDSRSQRVEGAEIVYTGGILSGLSEATVKGRIVLSLWSEGSEAAERQLLDMGATAVINVIDDPAMLEEVRRRGERERFVLSGEEDGTLHAYATEDAMSAGFGGDTWAELKAKAAAPGFEPYVLKTRINIETSSQVREVRTNNFVARLPGRVPNSGSILLMGHWDHLGICAEEGMLDRICNGAVDNASGVALLIELSRRLAANGPFDRDIYVLATTSEELGLLGAKAFAEAPSIPLDSIVAAFNFDTVAVAPNGKMLGFLGQGMTPLDPVIISTLHKMKRQLAPEGEVQGFLRRQDGWALLGRDVPVVVLSSSLGDMALTQKFIDTHYHRPSDEARSLVLGGAIDDLLLHEVLVKQFASIRDYPGPVQQTH
ncbi:MAG: M28 family peptidase [Alphaproteobacteria bacterium]|nr:MAG: M28 family peptidase [Alphaproteobacteria bacterium]